MEKLRVSFYPEGRTIEMEKGETLLTAANKAGIYVSSLCGGEGICGKCRLVVREGSVAQPSTTLLSREDIQRSYVLACQAVPRTDVEVELPIETRLEEVQIVTEGQRLFPGVEDTVGRHLLEKEIRYPIDPLTHKCYLDIPPPSLDDSLSDMARLTREVRRQCGEVNPRMSLANLATLPGMLRESKWKVTVTIGWRNGDSDILLIERGDVTARHFGVAVDIGTTTVAAMLIDLRKGALLSTKANPNTQMRFGEDVISRIIFAGTKGGLENLRTAVVDNINHLVAAMCLEASVRPEEITSMTVAGNTTMIHLFLGIDPTYIRQEPYIPVTNAPSAMRAAEAGLRISPRGILECVPGVSSYVGGDITAGVLACGMAESEEISLLLDVGTNGELVLGNRDWLLCCSASAGPAFEGGGIRCGMRASRGAIQRCRFDAVDRVAYDTIGSVPARGLCGSALIDIVAEMLRHKIIDRAGKIDPSFDSKRIRKGDEGTEYVLVARSETETGHDIIISDADIANIIRAKGALFVGADFLLKKAELTFGDIDHFYIAGGFGNYVNIDNAVTIGLLPDLPREKFEFIGNSSLTGARMALLARQALNKAREVATYMTNFELSVEPSFMNEYTSALFLPHTDLDKFPTVAVELGMGSESAAKGSATGRSA
jgi:uncharacterized 2Fe-2S/4Fe-4S cluster protein (DUF4445 family)